MTPVFGSVFAGVASPPGGFFALDTARFDAVQPEIANVPQPPHACERSCVVLIDLWISKLSADRCADVEGPLANSSGEALSRKALRAVSAIAAVSYTAEK